MEIIILNVLIKNNMKIIKFCKTHKIRLDTDINTLSDKYSFILKRLNYIVIKNKMTIDFDRPTNSTSDRFVAIAEGSKVLKSGTINFNDNNSTLKICWSIPFSGILFRAFFIGLFFSLIFYFYNSINIINTLVIFVLFFLITIIGNFIILKFRISYINNSVF